MPRPPCVWWLVAAVCGVAVCVPPCRAQGTTAPPLAATNQPIAVTQSFVTRQPAAGLSPQPDFANFFGGRVRVANLSSAAVTGAPALALYYMANGGQLLRFLFDVQTETSPKTVISNIAAYDTAEQQTAPPYVSFVDTSGNLFSGLCNVDCTALDTFSTPLEATSSSYKAFAVAATAFGTLIATASASDDGGGNTIEFFVTAFDAQAGPKAAGRRLLLFSGQDRRVSQLQIKQVPGTGSVPEFVVVARTDERRLRVARCAGATTSQSLVSCATQTLATSLVGLPTNLDILGGNPKLVVRDSVSLVVFFLARAQGQGTVLGYVACTSVACSGADRREGVVGLGAPLVVAQDYSVVLEGGVPTLFVTVESGSNRFVPRAYRCASFVDCVTPAASKDLAPAASLTAAPDGFVVFAPARDPAGDDVALVFNPTSRAVDLFASNACTNLCAGGACVNEALGALCTCPAGFELTSDAAKCVDVDECQTAANTCGQVCINRPGTFTCGCEADFELLADGTSCAATLCPAFELPSGVPGVAYTGCPETKRTNDGSPDPECSVGCATGLEGSAVQWACTASGNWSTAHPICFDRADVLDGATAGAVAAGGDVLHNAALIRLVSVAGSAVDPGDPVFLNQDTGALAATFSAPGTANVTLEFEGASGAVHLAAFLIPVAPELVVGDEQLVAVAGQRFEGNIPGLSGGLAPYAFAATGTLPKGLGVDPATGQIEGTPTETGRFDNILVRATDANGAVLALQPVSILVSDGLQVLGWDRPDGIPDALVGAPYSLPAPAFATQGGQGEPSFSLLGRFPSGFGIDSATGNVFGTPAKEEDARFSIAAQDDSGTVVVVEEVRLRVRLPEDCDVAANGPNGRGCVDGECVDGAAFDEAFTCRCTGELVGDNCDISSQQAPGAAGGDNSTVLIAAIGAVGGVLLLTLGLVYYLRRQHQRARNRPFDFQAELARMMEEGFFIHQATDENNKKVPREIARKRIKLTTKLGEGQFGDVFKGTVDESDARGVPEYLCAVKTLKNDPSGEEKQELMREACIMAQLDHPNVVNIVGVCTRGLPLLMVVQFCEHGALNSHLKARQDAGEAVPLAAMVRMALDIARGMEYLNLAGLIHRDLAARNVLLDSHFACKVADFGLSRDLDDSDKEYYRANNRGMVPVRWTAPEALEERKFSWASDVWSFGIVMVEIFTYAAMPYGDMTNQMVWVQVKSGFRLPCPDSCPPDLFAAVVAPCWMPKPASRPSFTDLCDLLESLEGKEGGLAGLASGGNAYAAALAKTASAISRRRSDEQIRAQGLMPEDGMGYVEMGGDEATAKAAGYALAPRDTLTRPRPSLRLRPSPPYVAAPDYRSSMLGSSKTDDTLPRGGGGSAARTRETRLDAAGAYLEPVPLAVQEQTLLDFVEPGGGTRKSLPKQDAAAMAQAAAAVASYDMFGRDDAATGTPPSIQAGTAGADAAKTIPGAYDSFGDAAMPGAYDALALQGPGAPDGSTNPALYA